MKSRQVPCFLYWRVENVQFWINSIGHLGWLSCISNFPRFHKNVNSLELRKYISENSSPKGSFWRNKKNPNFPNCREILHIYWQWLLSFDLVSEYYVRIFLSLQKWSFEIFSDGAHRPWWNQLKIYCFASGLARFRKTTTQTANGINSLHK